MGAVMIVAMLYFDHNATTPLLPAARAAWLAASDKFMGNPSSPHRAGARADAAIGSARAQLAGYLGCEADEIFWTSGATESNNTVLHHFAEAANSDAEVWVSAIEHPCVIESTGHFFSKRRRLLPVSRDGTLELGELESALKKARPALVAVMAVNNETGVLQPWREALALCQARGVPFFCDAAQWLGKLPGAGLGACDFVSGCAHKFGGPKGVGFLKCPGKVPLRPLLLGGHQEAGRRAGTENVPGILSMLAALEAREIALKSGEDRPRQEWRRHFEERLRNRLPETVVIGAGAERLWNTVCALMPSVDCRSRWVVKLDKAGYAVSTGSACAAGREEPSRVLAAMGCAPAEAARALRFSSGWETTEDDWSSLADGLTRVYRQMQSA